MLLYLNFFAQFQCNDTALKMNISAKLVILVQCRYTESAQSFDMYNAILCQHIWELKTVRFWPTLYI